MSWLCDKCGVPLADIQTASEHARTTAHFVLRADVAAAVAAMPVKARKVSL